MRMISMPLVLASLCVGCSASTSSRNMRTVGVVALVDVSSERPNRTTVEAELVVGDRSSNTYVVLEDGDRLSATVGSDTRVMSAVGKGEYEASFPVIEGEVVVSFERAAGDDDAPTSRGTIGPGFDIHPIHDGQPVSRTRDLLSIHWAPVDAQAEVVVELDGDCIFWKKLRLGGDTGSLALGPEELRVIKSKKNKSCAVDVEITRTRAGATDPALDSDSRFLLHQVRHARFVSAP